MKINLYKVLMNTVFIFILDINLSRNPSKESYVRI